jgi:hypothetical protein
MCCYGPHGKATNPESTCAKSFLWPLCYYFYYYNFLLFTCTHQINCDVRACNLTIARSHMACSVPICSSIRTRLALHCPFPVPFFFFSCARSFLTAEWPRNFFTTLPSPFPAELAGLQLGTVGSPLVAEASLRLAPRYHFAGIRIYSTPHPPAGHVLHFLSSRWRFVSR